MQVRPRKNQAGFSLLEMLFATIILLVGLVAIAQLVPSSILLNYRNRTDSSALVLGQRVLDQFLDQPLNASIFTDPAPGSPCALGCSLGDPAQPNIIQGSPLFPGQAIIDFAQAPVNGYSLIYPPVVDPNEVSYDVRWAVVIIGNGTTVSSKRFILGIRQQSGNGYFLPVTLDTMVSK